MIDSSFKFAGIAGAMALAISASVVAQDPDLCRSMTEQRGRQPIPTPVPSLD